MNRLLLLVVIVFIFVGSANAQCVGGNCGINGMGGGYRYGQQYSGFYQRQVSRSYSRPLARLAPPVLNRIARRPFMHGQRIRISQW